MNTALGHSFGRNKGNILVASQADMLHRFLPAWEVEISRPAPIIAITAFELPMIRWDKPASAHRRRNKTFLIL